MTAGSARRAALTAVAAVGAVGVGAGVWGVGVERFMFTVRRHRLAILHPGAASLRILHVSDLHMAPWQHRKQQWVAGLAALGPDLIVNTGDNLGHADGLRGLRAAFGPLRSIPGVFVHGSNDHVAPKPRNPFRYFTGPSKITGDAEPIDTDALDDYLTSDLGWRDLNNTATTMDAAGSRLNAFGVSDAHRHWDRLGETSQAVASLPKDAALTLGVTHAPYRRVLDAFIDLGAGILFAGHTHGGQVRVPGSRKALVANCDIPLDQARGLSSWTHRGRTVPLNVSAGLGHSIYTPVRFACRPEVSLLELVPRG